MENRGEPQDSFVTSTNESDDCQATVSELSYLIDSLNAGEQQLKRTSKTSTASPKTIRKKVKNESLPWYPNYLRLSLNVIGINNLKALKNVISFFHHNISRDVKDAYSKPSRAAKVKVVLSEALIYFHMCFSETKLPLEYDSYYNQMADLVSMYIDMELRASRRGKESTRKISCKLSSSLYTFLNSSVDHILDSVLKSKHMNKMFSEICIPVLKKILTPPFEQMNEFTYIRYVLVFKLWRRITTSQEEKKQITDIVSSILPPPSLEKTLKERFLDDILPPLRKNKKKLPLTLFLVITKINLKESIKEFMKRAAKPNDIAASDKSRFFKKTETNGDDEQGTSSELINSIWKSFINSSPTEDSYSTPSTSCINENKKTKKTVKSKKKGKKKKAKNKKLTKKKPKKKKKKKAKLIQKKQNNSNSSSDLFKEISNDVKLPTFDSFIEKPLPDITIENKESTDNKEDSFMNNLLTVLGSFKVDCNEGNVNNFINSNSSFLECEIVNTRSKMEENKDDYIQNIIDNIETTTYGDNVKTCRMVSDINKKSLQKLEGVTPIQESFDMLMLSKFDIFEKSNFHSPRNDDINKSAVSSSECLQNIKKIMKFDVNSDCTESNEKIEVKERNITNEENSGTEKIYKVLPYKIRNILDNEMSYKAVSDKQLIQTNDVPNVNSKHSKESVCSIDVSNNEVNFCNRTSSDLMHHKKLNFNSRIPDVATDIGMEISKESHDDAMCLERNKVITDSIPIDESSRQQKLTSSNKQVIKNLSGEPLSKTSNRLVENSVPKYLEGSKENLKTENHLPCNLKALHIAECVSDSSLENTANLENTTNKENNYSSHSANKENEKINFIFQPEDTHIHTESQQLHDKNDFEKATESVTKLSSSSSRNVNKVSGKITEYVQSSSNKTNQVASENFNEKHISQRMSVKSDTEKLINNTLETSSASTNPVVNNSQNIVVSTSHDYITGCGRRNSLTKDNEDISKSSSCKENRTLDVLSNLHNEYKLSSENSDTSAGEQHLQASNVDYKKYCSEEQSNMCENANTSHKKSPTISVNCSRYNEQTNIDIEDSLDSANCDLSVNKNLTQTGKDIAVGKKVVYTTDIDSKNNKIIVSTNTLTSSEEQCPLKISYTKEDVCPHILVKSCSKSFVNVSPLTDVGVIQSVSSFDISDAATIEREEYAMNNIEKGDKESAVLQIEEEKVGLLSNAQIPVSPCRKGISVTGSIKKDMKPNVSSIHNTSIDVDSRNNNFEKIDVDSSSKPTEFSSRSHHLYHMGTENKPCMKKTFILDNKQTCNRKKDNDKTVISNGKQTTSAVDVNAKHVAHSIKNKCDMQEIPLSVCDERECVQKTTVCGRSNIHNMKTMPKENVETCAHTKILSSDIGNKIIEATNTEKMSAANVLQEKVLDISRSGGKITFNKAVCNSNEKLVDACADQSVSLREEEKEEAKTISECDSRFRSTLNTCHVTTKEESRATVKTEVSDIQLKNRNTENDQDILDAKICKTKLCATLDMSSEVEHKHPSQKESLVCHTSITEASILSREKISLSNLISNNLVSPNTASINKAVKESKSDDKYNRSVAEKIPGGKENVIVTSEANIYTDNYGLVTAVKNIIEDSLFNKSQNNSSNGDATNNFKHCSFDVKSKENDGNQQIIHFPGNTEAEEKESPKASTSTVFLSQRMYGNSQDDKSNFSNLCENKLYIAENSDESKGNICVATSGTDVKKLSIKSSTVDSCHKNSTYLIDKIEKIKHRANPISDNEQPTEKCQINTSVLLESKEIYETELKKKEFGVLSLKLNDYSLKKNFSEESSNVASTKRKQQDITPSVEIVSQSTISDMKQKKGKISAIRNMSENGNLKKICSKSNNPRTVKCKSNVTEDKLNKGSNVHSKNNSIWKMINLDCPSINKNNCLPETSYSDRVYKLTERNESNLNSESEKQSLVLTKYNDKDKYASVKSSKIRETYSDTLAIKYVPVKDSSSSFKMKFVKVPVEKGTVEASDATKQQKHYVDSIDVKKCVLKLDNELLHIKGKKSKSSSLRHYDYEKNKEHVNLISTPHDANIETSSLRVEEKNNTKLSQVKKNDKCLIKFVQVKTVTSGEMQCKPLITTAKKVSLYPGNKLYDSSEKVDTIEGSLVESHKKLSKSDSHPNSNLSVKSSEMQWAVDNQHDGLASFEKKENNVAYNTKTKRKRKHSIPSPRKEHHSNHEHTVITSKEAIPVLNLMKLPNNQWSDKAKLDLEPYVKLKKLTDHELLTLTNHAIETPVLNQDVSSSGSDFADNKIECNDHSSHKEVNKKRKNKDIVDVKRAKLSATFIKVDQEWRIAEPAVITVEIECDNKTNKDMHTKKISNNVNGLKVLSQNPVKSLGVACQTERSLNKFNKSKTEYSINIPTDSSLNTLHQNVDSPHQLSTTKLKACVSQNIVSEKHQFVSQPESDSYCMPQTAGTHNNRNQNIKSSSKELTTLLDPLVDKREVNEQNYVHRLTCDSSLPNCEVKHCIPDIQQQPVKKVVFLRHANSDQTLATSSTVVTKYMREVNCQSSVSHNICQVSEKHNNSTYSDKLQTEVSGNKPHCQELSEKDNYHLDTDTMVHGSTDNFFGTCTEDKQNNKIYVATSSLVNNTATIKNECKMNSCNISKNSGSPTNRSSINKCPESTSSQHNILDTQAMLHDWTASNPAVPETPLDYTVTQSQSVDSWTVLDSRSKNSNDDIDVGTNEIQGLSKLQQVSTDVKTYSEYVDRKLSEEKLNNIHLQTLNSDYNVCCSQMKYKDYLILEVSDTATLPYPPQIPGDAHHPVIRCCCQQCCRNYHVLINNYNKLVHYRSLKMQITVDNKQREKEEILPQLEREHNEPDSSLPLKKRKTLTQSTTENKIMSYPNTPMISIAELEIANYSHSKRLIVPNPSVPLYSRLGTEPVPSQYVARTSDWNVQNCTEDQNHLPATPTEPNNLGGHNVINFVAQSNVSQYIVNGQEETARVKRELKRQKQSLRNEWRIWGA